MTILSFFRDFRAELHRVRFERERRLRAIHYVAEHPDDFIGKEVAAIEAYCGGYDSYSSHDFGDWSAQWRERKVLLSAYMRKDKCAEISLLDI